MWRYCEADQQRTPMQPDFLDAHDRHRHDAELLYSQKRWANADHLFGLAAECGLKRLMIAFGMVVGSEGRPQDSLDRVHADKVWARYEAYRSGYANGSNYVLTTNNPFSGWDISQRYARGDQFDESRVSAHRRGAEVVRTLLKQARVDGILS